MAEFNRSEAGPLEPQFVQYFAYQILVRVASAPYIDSHDSDEPQRGLKYLHSAGVVHRDIKPSNLVIDENCDLKICDFGLSRPQDHRMTGYVSTRYYRAPEVMLTWQRYGVEVDIWSAGCVIAEMFNGKPLFPGQDPINQFYLILDVLGNPSDKFISRISEERFDWMFNGGEFDKEMLKEMMYVHQYLPLNVLLLTRKLVDSWRCSTFIKVRAWQCRRWVSKNPLSHNSRKPSHS
ncbi:unnamed protein product [Aspergillus oryzae]|uniref:Unnamed protein product n=2 Tax=Aspergillus oryzae TaxID=5062 RepID=A0AAN5BNR3_ASPOZ|nr:unnamed protein product [Aspergillus oryzae]GMF90191.1 unnamed protein product [Aspergillus oryzae]GMG07784.1 unnamed protein product [Aspergillus oryzae]GMG24813.1 unnamed protein product [Aspergillus oryzae]GMG48089.1 unnamed protein product [Aspergillus oryzae var. brunneus]